MEGPDDTPSLREQVEDEEILPLFTEDREQLQSVVRHLIVRTREDPQMESELIETLELSLDQECDDSEASVWIAVILGEARSRRSLDVLMRCLTLENDEMIQDAAGVALLRIGVPAAVTLMENVEEERGRLFNQAAYRWLGETGILADDMLHRRILDFFEERFPLERRCPPDESALEELVAASARLGHRKLLPSFQRLLARRFGGRQPVIEDAISLLEENDAGVPFVPTIPPWEERYGWLFEDDRERARVDRDPASPEGREAIGFDYRDLFGLPDEEG